MVRSRQGVSPSVATAMSLAPRALTSSTLESVFSKTRDSVAMATTGIVFVDQRDGAVLQLAGGVAFGVDVGDLLELERALQGDRVVDVAADEEKVLFFCRTLGDLESASSSLRAARMRPGT